MTLRQVAGIDIELGIVAVALATRSGISSVEVITRSPGAGIADLVKVARVPEKATVIGIGGHQVFLRTMKLPGDLDSKSIAETVKWQLADVVPDRIVRHYVTGKLNDSWCVIVGGVSRETVREIKTGVVDLRVAALWRGATHLVGKENSGPMAIVEHTPSGYRVAAGRGFLEFAREISSNAEAELERTLLYCRSELNEGDKLRILHVGRELPDETVAIGLALHYHAEPRFNFLVKERTTITWLADVATGKRFWKVVAVGTALALLPYLATYGYRIQTSEYKKRTAAMITEVKKYETLKAEREKYEDWIAIVESFATSPAWPIINDMRYAVPSKCWLTSLKTERPQKNTTPEKPSSSGGAEDMDSGSGQVGGSGNSSQSVQIKKTSSRTTQQIPDRPSSIIVEGYSLDVTSVGLLRDNLEALPWCGGITEVSVKLDEQVNAYSFRISMTVKQQKEKSKK